MYKLVAQVTTGCHFLSVTLLDIILSIEFIDPMMWHTLVPVHLCYDRCNSDINLTLVNGSQIPSLGNLCLYVSGPDIHSYWLWVLAKEIYYSTIIGHKGFYYYFVRGVIMHEMLCSLEKSQCLASILKRSLVGLGVIRFVCTTRKFIHLSFFQKYQWCVCRIYLLLDQRISL